MAAESGKQKDSELKQELKVEITKFKNLSWYIYRIQPQIKQVLNSPPCKEHA